MERKEERKEKEKEQEREEKKKVVYKDKLIGAGAETTKGA